MAFEATLGPALPDGPGTSLGAELDALTLAWSGPARETAASELKTVHDHHLAACGAWFLEHFDHYSEAETRVRISHALLSFLVARLGARGWAPGELRALLEQFVGRFRQASHARVLLAELHLEAGHPDIARTLLKKVIIEHSTLLLPQQRMVELLRAQFDPATTPVAEGYFIGSLADRFCPVPFDDAATDSLGSMWTCCPSQLPVPIGDFFTTPWEEIWHSIRARELRRSILDGDFSYCSRLHCPKILSGTLPRRAELTGPRYEQLLRTRDGGDVLPIKVVFGHDATCNLACPQCRTELYKMPPEQALNLDRAMTTMVEPLLEQAAHHPFTFFLAGNGDPFASEHYLGILRRLDPARHTQVSLRLLTNGLLFRQAWQKLENIRPMLRRGCVKVSLDGASPEVYRLTRGASWEKLMENLDFLADLRRRGEVASIGCNMTVQDCNFPDMIPLAELAVRLGFDTLEFNGLRNEGTYPEEVFRARTVFEPDHPRHAQFLEVLRHPALRAGFITFGTLTPLFLAAREEGVRPCQA